jgi:Tetracyclin repressor-like, C-terminal domain
MRQIFVAQLEPMLAKLQPTDVTTRAGLVATQIMGLALCRYVLRLPPIVEMSREQIVEWIGPTIQRYVAS